MADTLTVTTAASGDVSSIPTGTIIATDDCGATGHIQRVKLDIGGDGASSPVTSTGLPVTDASGSLTVDAPVGTPVFVRLSDGSAAISTLPVSLASVPSHAVTGPLTDTEIRASALPVSLASVPSHAVTNAGTFAVQATVAAGAAAIAKAEDDASANLDVGVPSMAVRKASPANTSGTDGDYEMLQMSAGRLWTSATIDAALPAGTNNIGDVDVLTLPALVAGTANIGDVDVLTVPADPFGVNADAASATGSISAKLRFIAATGIPITTLPALVAGSAAIGKLAANSGVDIGDVDVTSIAAGTNTIGAVNVKPATTGGLSVSHLMSAGTTNATVAKASAGQLFGWYIYNSNAAARKVAFHNTASTPTAGSSVFFTLMIPAASAANVELTNGIAFSSGIAFTTVTGLADSDNTAVAANDLTINLFYA